jgi:CheY-like chemotaxis protein
MFRILIIDDDLETRLMLRETLEGAGYEVEEAENGTEGLNLYRRRPIHLIITDVVMPEKGGLEVIMELRRETRMLPIIAMLGGGQLRSKEALPSAHEPGASEILSKPFTREEILRAVESALQRLR